MANTSSTCSICGGSGYLKSRDGSMTRCECRVQLQSEARLTTLSIEANLPNYPSWSPDMYTGTKSVDNMRKIRLFVDQFDTKFKTISMYWLGGNSTQKTTSAHWIAVELLKKGKSVQYVTMQNLVKDLMEGESFSKTVDVSKYYNADFLIIDESFDPTKVTLFKSKFQIPFLDSFVRERVEIRRRSTLFISNVGIEQVDMFSTSLRALVERCTVGSVFTFEDRFVQNVSTIQNLWEE